MVLRDGGIYPAESDDYRKVPSLMEGLVEYIDDEQKKQNIDVLQFALKVHFHFAAYILLPTLMDVRRVYC